MKNLFKALFMVLILSSSLVADKPKGVQSNELKEIKSLAILHKAQIDVSNAYDMGSLFILDASYQGKPQELFLTKDKKMLIAGNVMDSQTGDGISLPIDVSITQGKEAFTFGSGSDEYILFTDLECPYCKKFEAFFPELEKHVKIRVFLYPLSFHENARDLSIYVMSQKTLPKMIDTFLTVDAQSPEFINRKINKNDEAKLQIKLQDQMQIAQKLNVAGTPTLFDKNGKKVVWVKLLEKYNIEPK
ncbi:MAG: thioredoxin fold domain-containing protein [Arcobacteraceae bacterium]